MPATRAQGDARATLTLRLNLAPRGAVGPGKIKLLELVGKTGSISAAGRAMAMSYRRAWLLIDELNHIFDQPLVETQLGGKAGGGATLTSFGRKVVGEYRAMEDEAHAAFGPRLRLLQAHRAKPPQRRRSAKTSV